MIAVLPGSDLGHFQDNWAAKPTELDAYRSLASPYGIAFGRNGEGEIRTPATLAGRPVFETGAFSRSATSPGGARVRNPIVTPTPRQRPHHLLDDPLRSCRLLQPRPMLTDVVGEVQAPMPDVTNN